MQTTDQTTQNTQPESSQDKPDDLLESLLLLCNLYGVSTTKDALTSGLPLINGRLTPNLLSRAAARARLTCKINKAGLNQIPTEFLPAMLLLEGEGACLLLGWDAEKKYARVILPSVGEAEVQLTIEELASRYQGVVIVIDLALQNIRVTVKGDKATAQIQEPKTALADFGQAYSNSLGYKDEVNKELEFELIENNWQIIRESVVDCVAGPC